MVGYCLLMVPLALREPRRTLFAVWLATAAATLTSALLAPKGSSAVTTACWGSPCRARCWCSAARCASGPRPMRLLVEQEHISEAERGRRTLLEERARIARELHDVVAHHMSVIAVQAASAPYRLTGVPADAAEEFTAISRHRARLAGRDAAGCWACCAARTPTRRRPRSPVSATSPGWSRRWAGPG